MDTPCASGSGQKACQSTQNDVEKSITKDLKSKDADTRAAAAAYGTRGVANGVTVTIGDPGAGHAGNAVATGVEADPNNPGSFSQNGVTGPVR